MVSLPTGCGTRADGASVSHAIPQVRVVARRWRCVAMQHRQKAFSDHGETPLFERQQYQLLRERNRNEGSPFLQKKPVGRVSWAAETQWTRCR